MMTVTTFPRSRPLTWRDLESVPDDGHRYEPVDGAVVVTPAPSHHRPHAQASPPLSGGLPFLLDFRPDAPLLTAWELSGKSYHQVAQARSADVFRAASPLAVEIVPSALVR